MSQSTMSEQFRILKQYIEQKDYDNFNGFLDNNDISKKTLNSLLCLTLQIYRSNFQMTDYIELLIAKGAEQNSMFHNILSTPGPKFDEKDNVSILMYACIYSDIRLIDLIATEKNINLKDKNGKNALFYVLCAKGDNPDVIGALLYHNIDVDCIGKIDIGDKTFESHTALSLAATKNIINTFKVLIDKGANPNFKIVQTGDTILHIAVKKGNIEMVKILLDTNKIKFEEKNKENKTALELALELNDENIYNLIKEKIEEGNRQGEIVAKELLIEDKKNIIKKQNEIKNTNYLNDVNKINQNKNEKNNNSSNKKIANIMDLRDKLNNKRQINRIKIINNYFNNYTNKGANLEIKLSLSDNKINSNEYFNSENNKENMPVLKIDLLSKEFNEYKEYLNSKKIEENEKRRILEEENEYIKKKLETISEKNKYIANKLNESEFQKKELETKYQLEIIELKKKIAFLEKEHENDKLVITELKKHINMSWKEISQNIENENKINNNSNKNSEYINYLNKKFINYDYNFDFSQDKDKNNYVINCLSKDISEFEKFVSAHIKSSSNIHQELLNNVEKVVNECIPDYGVHLYGSHATNLCLPWSDLDVVLVPRNNNNNNQNSNINNQILLNQLYENIKKKEWVKESKYISSASIPIIKLICDDTFNNMPIDISIQDERHFGLKCVELVKGFISQYECLKPLVLVLKNILKRANLNDPYKGGISSYGLILMIVTFLQTQKKIGKDISNNENNLGRLFFDFVNHYGLKFEPSKYIIYARTNEDEDSDDLNIQNIQIGNELVIIDPLNPSNNVAKSCFQFFNIKMSLIICIITLKEDCECGCHYTGAGEAYNNLNADHCFLKRIFNSVKRFQI